jgi:hypothetical protein
MVKPGRPAARHPAPVLPETSGCRGSPGMIAKAF